MPLLPLVPLALGAGSAILANQQKDPNAGFQREALKGASELSRLSKQNLAGGGAADIRNTAANRATRTQNRAAASGTGQTPRVAEELGKIAGEEARGIIQLRQMQAERNARLRDEAARIRAQVAASQGQFKAGRRGAVIGALAGGVQGGLSMFNQQQQIGKQDQFNNRLLAMLGGRS